MSASCHKAVTIVAFLFFLFSVKKWWSFQKLVSTRKVQKRQRNLSFALCGAFHCYMASLSYGTLIKFCVERTGHFVCGEGTAM